MATAVGILAILLELSLHALILALAVDLLLRRTRRGRLPRELWATLLIGTGVVLLLNAALRLI